MAMEPSELRSRRALLAGSIGALAALAAQAIGRPDLASADDGDAVRLGQQNTQTGTFTELRRSDNKSRIALIGPTYGVTASTDVSGGTGLDGFSGGTHDTIGVKGRTNGHYSQTAVDADARTGNGEGYAVRARTKNGIGVYAEATGGVAIRAKGRTEFSRSGKVTFSKGQASRTIKGNTIFADSLVVATIQGDVSGTWVRGVTVSTSKGQFTIRLNKAAPKQLKVGWFIVN